MLDRKSTIAADNAVFGQTMTAEAQEGRDAFTEKRAADFGRFPRRP